GASILACRRIVPIIPGPKAPPSRMTAGADARVGREPGQVRKEAALSGPGSVPSLLRSSSAMAVRRFSDAPESPWLCHGTHSHGKAAGFGALADSGAIP